MQSRTRAPALLEESYITKTKWPSNQNLATWGNIILWQELEFSQDTAWHWYMYLFAIPKLSLPFCVYPEAAVFRRACMHTWESVLCWIRYSCESGCCLNRDQSYAHGPHTHSQWMQISMSSMLYSPMYLSNVQRSLLAQYNNKKLTLQGSDRDVIFLPVLSSYSSTYLPAYLITPRKLWSTLNLIVLKDLATDGDAGVLPLLACHPWLSLPLCSKAWNCCTSRRWWGSTSLFSPAVRTTTPWRQPQGRCRTSLRVTGLWVDGKSSSFLHFDRGEHPEPEKKHLYEA